MSTSSAATPIVSPQPTERREGPQRSIKDLFQNQTSYFIAYVIVCFVTVILHCGFNRNAATSFLWALACTTVGAAFGFLFGIPKILQGNQPAADETVATASVAYRQQVNTNLTEISDWLTKIIVGLGLINLGRIPEKLGAVAQTLAESIDGGSPQSHKAFAYGLIVCFPILGFLAAYLYTRLFLQGAFSRADQEAAQQQRQNETDARVATLETRLDTQEGLVIETTTAPPAPMGAGVNGEEEISIDPEDSSLQVPVMVGLRKIADEYLNVTARDYHTRLRMKNELGKKLFNYVLRNGISKDDLVREFESSGNEGIALALAHYVLASPGLGDISRLQAVGYGVRRWHVQYRIVQAIGQVFEKHCVVLQDSDIALRLLLQYEQAGDAALKKLIQGTRSIVERNLAVAEGVGSTY